MEPNIGKYMCQLFTLAFCGNWLISMRLFPMAKHIHKQKREREYIWWKILEDLIDQWSEIIGDVIFTISHLYKKSMPLSNLFGCVHVATLKPMLQWQTEVW